MSLFLASDSSLVLAKISARHNNIRAAEEVENTPEGKSILMGPVGITRSARPYNWLKPGEKDTARLVPWYVEFEIKKETTTAAECPVRNCVYVTADGDVSCGSAD